MNDTKKAFGMALVGAPGAGKGTVATWLEKEFNFYRICPGDLLRQEVEADTTLGKKVASFLQKGHLIPDELLISLMHEKIRQKPKDAFLLLDGYPRTIDQFQALQNAGLLPYLFLQLVASKPILLKRILGRRIHLRSGRVYHSEFSPPQHPDLDDITLEPLTIRKDDTLELALERIRQSEERDAALLGVFRQNTQTSPEDFKFEQFSTEDSIPVLRQRLEARLALLDVQPIPQAVQTHSAAL